MKKLECGCATEADVDRVIQDLGSLMIHSANIHNICRESIHYAMVRLFHNFLLGAAEDEEEYEEYLSTLQKDIADVHRVFGMEEFKGKGSHR